MGLNWFKCKFWLTFSRINLHFSEPRPVFFVKIGVGLLAKFGSKLFQVKLYFIFQVKQ